MCDADNGGYGADMAFAIDLEDGREPEGGTVVEMAV
jgi:hypothetical protein